MLGQICLHKQQGESTYCTTLVLYQEQSSFSLKNLVNDLLFLDILLSLGQDWIIETEQRYQTLQL